MSGAVTVIFLDQSFEKFCMFLKSVPWYFFHNSANFFHFLYICYLCFIFLLEFLVYFLLIFTQTFFVILYPDVNSRGAVKLKEVFWVAQGGKGSLVEFGHMGSMLNADWLVAKGPSLTTVLFLLLDFSFWGTNQTRSPADVGRQYHSRSYWSCV